MTSMTSLLCVFAFIAACAVSPCPGQASAEAPLPGVPRAEHTSPPTEILLGEEHFTQHIQGIAADESGIYWSMFDVVVKTDWKGNVLKKARVSIHAGDCCLAHGHLFVSVCPWGAGAKAKDAMGQLHECDSELNFVRKIPLPETPRPDGIVFHGGRFYIANDDFGREPHPFNFVHIYDSELRLLRKVKVDIGLPTNYGVQTLNVLNGKLLAGCYGDKGRSPLLDMETLAVVEPRFPRGVTVGFAVVPVSVAGAENVCLIANNLKANVSDTKTTFSAKLFVCQLQDGILKPFALGK